MKPFSFVTPTASADGYGASGEALALSAVRDHGADIAIVGYGGWVDERYCDPEFLALKQPESVVAERDVSVVYFLPFALDRFRARRTTLSMTMWETDRIPDVWAELINRFADGLIVPSEHGARVFGERVDVPIRVAPLGTDVDLYEFVERSPEDESFVFCMAGLLHYRKGLEFALRAFREEFEPGEKVELWLKTRQRFIDYGSEWAALQDPRITIYDQDFTRGQMANLYQSVDCFLAPSRGEGSGLTPRDAMATGLPVILTNWGGLAELADERYAYPISVEDLEPAPAENSSYGVGVTRGSDIGCFARPSVPEIRKAMRSVFEDRDEGRRRGREAALWVRRQWTWERCAFRWLAAIDDLSRGES